MLVGCVALLAVANTVNLGADLGAMGEAASLLIGGPAHPYVVLFGLVSALSAILVDYRVYVRILRWLTLSLLAYVAAVLAVPVPWDEVLFALAVPPVALSPAYLLDVTAVLGTTIAPYLVFWQAAEEVEDLDAGASSFGSEAPATARREIRRIRLDTWVGIGFSNLVGFFVIVAAAATLNRAGITEIETAEQAAQALRPIACSTSARSSPCRPCSRARSSKDSWSCPFSRPSLSSRQAARRWVHICRAARCWSWAGRPSP